MDTLKIKEILERPYERNSWISIVKEVFGAQRIFSNPSSLDLSNKRELAKKVFEIANMDTNDDRIIGFYEIEVDDSVFLERNKVGLRNLLRSIYKYDVDGAVIVFKQSKKWRLSYISEIRELDIHDRVVYKETEAKRYTYLLGEGEYCRTPAERLNFISTRRKNLVDIKEAFSVDTLTKEFYELLSDWYHRAVKKVEFPGYREQNKSESKKDYKEYLKSYKAQSVIRLITRLMFVWFLKQRIDTLDKLFVAQILTQLNGSDVNNSTYYKAILQNLFFATFNTNMNQDEPSSRRWVKDGNQNSEEFLDQRYYRYKKYFKDDESALELFADIPFLNGGLFDNLDYLNEETGKAVRVDCFSNSSKNDSLLMVPDSLFWETEVVDLSSEYNSKKKDRVKVFGLIPLLSRFNFTLEENTPLDKEVALDPELLGKVFENLLASYNEETKTAARNQTGSFYTPREVVNYMVDESLKAYLLEKLTGEKVESYAEIGKTQADMFGNEGRRGQQKLVEEFGHTQDHILEYKKRLNHLFNYNETSNPFKGSDTEKLIEAIDHVKIIDPANGTGAYPMGALLRIVNLLNKLDPDNEIWKERQLESLRKIEDPQIKNEALESVESAFRNNPDYGRKLYLIENCLYGVDIQPIACQISKLRFFISLIVDQKFNFNLPNFGIRALPNLETKFVAADTLVPLEEDKLIPNEVYRLKRKLKNIRDAYFVAKSRETKKKRQREDKEVRQQIANILRDAGFLSAAADQIAEWNPYDQNKSSNWFNTEWMFNIGSEFDIVLGNPPYIQLQKNGGKLGKKYKAYNYDTFESTGDIYSLFYERGMQLLKPGGILSYITSNKWMRAGYGKSTRNYFSKKTNPLLVIDFGNVQIFETATVDTAILLLQRSRPKAKTMACRFDNQYQKGKSLTDFIAEEVHPIEMFSENEWVILTPETAQIKKFVEKQGIELRSPKWEIDINYGIKTGLNEAFIINKKTRDDLMEKNKKNEAILKPILRGKDIQKWYPDFAEQYLVSLLPSKNIDIKKYPEIEKYFISEIGKQRLEQSGVPGSRKKTSNKWFETQDSISYWEQFDKPKIIYPNMTKYLPFVFDDEDHFYCNDKAFILTGVNIEYLCCFFNSSLFKYCFIDNFPELQGGTREVRKIFVDKIKVKQIPVDLNNYFRVIVKCLQIIKKEGFKSQRLFEQVSEGLLFDIYFEDEMRNKELTIIETVKNEISSMVDMNRLNELKEEDYLEVIGKLTKIWSDPYNSVRNRIKLFPTKSPDLLGHILQTK